MTPLVSKNARVGLNMIFFHPLCIEFLEMLEMLKALSLILLVSLKTQCVDLPPACFHIAHSRSLCFPTNSSRCLGCQSEQMVTKIQSDKPISLPKRHVTYDVWLWWNCEIHSRTITLKGLAFPKQQTAKQPSSKNARTQNRPIAYGQENYVRISQALNRRHRTRMNNHDSQLLQTCNFGEWNAMSWHEMVVVISCPLGCSSRQQELYVFAPARGRSRDMIHGSVVFGRVWMV